MFDIPCCYWQTHSWMTLSNLLSTELRSGLLGGHIWCVVQIFMSQQLSALAHAWCAGKQKAPAAATVWAARHHSNMHHSLSPLATWKPHQCTYGDTDWNRHARTCLSDTSEGRQWAEAASDWNVVSNQQSFVDQAIDQWQCVSQSQKQTQNICYNVSP